MNDHVSAAYRRRDFLKAAAGGALMVTGASRLGWAATGSGRGTLRLVFFTDVHARIEWDTPLAMARAAAAMNRAKPDLVLAGGDLVTDGFQASSRVAMAPRWDAYMAMHDAIDGEKHAAMGAHDMVAADPEDGSPASADPRAEFRARLGVARTYYSFDALGYHFMILDSIHISGGEYPFHGMIRPDEMAWLKEDLGRVASDTPIIAVLHVPLLTAFYAATDGATSAVRPNRVVGNNVEVLEAFSGHNLHLVLEGHMHVNELFRWRGTTLITGGAVSGKCWRGPWHVTDAGFNIVTLADDHIEWEYVEYGWRARRPVDQ